MFEECDRAYDSIIASLEKCKSGVDRGHPDIKNGCLLHLDLTAPEFQCRSTERQGQKRYKLIMVENKIHFYHFFGNQSF